MIAGTELLKISSKLLLKQLSLLISLLQINWHNNRQTVSAIHTAHKSKREKKSH